MAEHSLRGRVSRRPACAPRTHIGPWSSTNRLHAAACNTQHGRHATCLMGLRTSSMQQVVPWVLRTLQWPAASSAGACTTLGHLAWSASHHLRVPADLAGFPIAAHFCLLAVVPSCSRASTWVCARRLLQWAWYPHTPLGSMPAAAIAAIHRYHRQPSEPWSALTHVHTLPLLPPHTTAQGMVTAEYNSAKSAGGVIAVDGDVTGVVQVRFRGVSYPVAPHGKAL